MKRCKFKFEAFAYFGASFPFLTSSFHFKGWRIEWGYDYSGYYPSWRNRGFGLRNCFECKTS